MLTYNSVFFHSLIEAAKNAGAIDISVSDHRLSIGGSMNDRALNVPLMQALSDIMTYIDYCSNRGSYLEHRVEKKSDLLSPCTIHGYTIFDFGEYDSISIIMTCYD